MSLCLSLVLNQSSFIKTAEMKPKPTHLKPVPWVLRPIKYEPKDLLNDTSGKMCHCAELALYLMLPYVMSATRETTKDLKLYLLPTAEMTEFMQSLFKKILKGLAAICYYHASEYNFRTWVIEPCWYSAN